MQNKLFKKGLVIGVIFLFFTLSIQPITSVEIKQDNNSEPLEVENSSVKDDCGCKKIDTQIFDSLKENLNKIDFDTKLSLVLLKNIPELTEKNRELFDKIIALDEHFKEFNNNIKLLYNQNICLFIFAILIYYGSILIIIIQLSESEIIKNPVLIDILDSLEESYDSKILFWLDLYDYHECPWPPDPPVPWQ